MTVATEQPMNNAPQLSCCRVAVYKQYYGINLRYISHDRIVHITYRYKSCVGTDPDTYITKPFDTDIQIMSKYILNILRTLYSHVSTDILDLRYDFNSCTILSYIKNSKMPFHSDTKYTKNGIYHNNGQVQNTAVVIITYGDDHILNWRRVSLHDEKWIPDQYFANLPMILIITLSCYCTQKMKRHILLKCKIYDDVMNMVMFD